MQGYKRGVASLLMKKHLILLGGVVLLAAYLLLNTPHEKEGAFVVLAKGDGLAAIAETNTVYIRIIYPFSDTQGAVGAVTYLSAVLSAKGKTVIIQVIEENTCSTNEGNVLQEKIVPVEECNGAPFISISEGTNTITITDDGIEISAKPKYLQSAASYILKKIYPDADIIYREVFGKVLSR